MYSRGTTMLKLRSLRFLAALFLAAATTTLFAQEPATGDAGTLISMFHGEVRTLPVSNVQRVAVGNGRLLTTTVLDKEVLLLAEAFGDTSLFIWLKDGSLKKYSVRI